MFANSQATTIVGLNKFNTSKVRGMDYMFHNSEARELDLSNFNISSLLEANGMFSGSKATTVWVNNTNIANYFIKLDKSAGLTFRVK